MKLKITVHGVAYEVDVEVLDAAEGFPEAAPLPAMRPPAAPTTAPERLPPPGTTRASVESPGARPAPPVAMDRRSVASPVAGTVLQVRCRQGDTVEPNQVLFVLETMKMETSIAAPAGGLVAEVLVAAGDAVEEGRLLLTFA